MQHTRLASTLLAVLALGLGACAVDPDDMTAEDTDQVGSALTVGGIGTTELSPATTCASTAADGTIAVAPGWQSSSGASLGGSPCSWRVVELTGTSGRKVDIVVSAGPTDPVVPQNRCADSVMADVVYGLTPGFYRWGPGGGLDYVPPRWEQVDTHSQRGTWVGGACHFTHYEQNSPQGAGGHTVVVRAPYSMIRVATRARLVRADGTVKYGSLVTHARTLPLLPGE